MGILCHRQAQLGVDIAESETHTDVDSKGRGAKEMDDQLGPDALENTVLITDSHSAYFSMKVKGHQICIAHLLRNLNWLNELDKKTELVSKATGTFAKSRALAKHKSGYRGRYDNVDGKPRQPSQ